MNRFPTKKLELQEELNFYKSKKEEWLEQYNKKFLLIKGNELIDYFDTSSDAHKDGVRRFGSELFFIKQLVEAEPIAKFPSITLGLINARL